MNHNEYGRRRAGSPTDTWSEVMWGRILLDGFPGRDRVCVDTVTGDHRTNATLCTLSTLSTQGGGGAQNK